MYDSNNSYEPPLAAQRVVGPGGKDMKYVIDTCIINKLVDGLINVRDLPSDGVFLTTHIQHDELSNTKTVTRRAELLNKFSEIIQEDVPTETAICGISRVGQCRVGDGRLFTSIKGSLDALNNSKTNNTQDALIAEVAIANGYTLVTADNHLRQVAIEHGCNVIHFNSRQ